MPTQLSLYQLGALSMKKQGREKEKRNNGWFWFRVRFGPGDCRQTWPLPEISAVSPAAQTDNANDFPFPENSSLPQECYFHSQSSGEKRLLDVSSLLLLKNSHSHDVAVRDLVVVATSARLGPRPGRRHTGAMRDPCIQHQEAYSHCLIAGRRQCERK